MQYTRSTGSRAGYGETVFPSVGPAVTRTFFIRAWLAFVLVGAVGAFVIDSSFWRDPYLVGFVALFPMLCPWIMTRSSKGEIRVTNEGITLEATRTARYSWEDIASLRLTSIAERSSAVVSLYRFFGFDVNRQFLEMRLRRSVRLNPINENQSTRGWGIPSVFFRASHLYANDPLALLAAAEIHLKPGVHR